MRGHEDTYRTMVMDTGIVGMILVSDVGSTLFVWHRGGCRTWRINDAQLLDLQRQSLC